MREYELTLIYKTDEEVFKSTSEKVKTILKNSSVKIEKEEDLGVRDLAYVIKKENKGKYIFSIVNVNPEKIVDIENKFRLEAGLLKFLFVRKEN
ncbi:MAG: 30S ribosomal protein S6 [Spirochaetales bacterium]|nr:30S ribosomal protein S6 [Spirochaetales bacterium]